MAESDPFFQFPLRMLISAKDSQQIVQDACVWSLLHYGQSLTDEARTSAADEYMAKHPGCQQFNEDDDDELSIAAAAVRLGVNVPNVKAKSIQALALQAKYGDGGQQVRLRADIAWSAHNDNWPLLKLKVLCGVYSGIGNRHILKMNHRLLRAYCSGHSSPKGLKDSQLIPISTMRYWIEQLWMKNFFQFCLHGRERWYSLTCKSDSALAVKVKSQSQPQTTKKVVSTNDV